MKTVEQSWLGHIFRITDSFLCESHNKESVAQFLVFSLLFKRTPEWMSKTFLIETLIKNGLLLMINELVWKTTPVDTRRKDNVIMTSQRRRDVVLTLLWRYFCVVRPLGLRIDACGPYLSDLFVYIFHLLQDKRTQYNMSAVINMACITIAKLTRCVLKMKNTARAQHVSRKWSSASVKYLLDYFTVALRRPNGWHLPPVRVV